MIFIWKRSKARTCSARLPLRNSPRSVPHWPIQIFPTSSKSPLQRPPPSDYCVHYSCSDISIKCLVRSGEKWCEWCARDSQQYFLSSKWCIFNPTANKIKFFHPAGRACTQTGPLFIFITKGIMPSIMRSITFHAKSALQTTNFQGVNNRNSRA